MTIPPREISISDAEPLLSIGEKLLEEAYELPNAVATVAVGGSDPPSRAIAAEMSEYVEPTIIGLSSDKDGMIRDANNLINAAKAVLGFSASEGAQI